MSIPITPEALIEAGFEDKGYLFTTDEPFIVVHADHGNEVYLGLRLTNATTMEDIHDLIRLFR